jgi:ATP-dependent helicase/nuclease subunit B
MMQLKSSSTLQKPLLPVWQAVKQYYETSEKWRTQYRIASRPLFKANEAVPITEQMAEQLYGDHFQASVSRIENYYSCSYAHFISYGLKLSERQEFKLETFAMGDLFHDALRRILSEKDGLMSQDSTFQDCMNKAADTVESIITGFSYQILQSSARYQYIKKKLIKIVGRTLYALLKQHHITHFKPIAHEKSFGMKGLKNGTEEEHALEGLKIKLNKNREMVIRGQIDRIDGYKDGNEMYLRVVDYKSSKHDLNLTEVYNGISLQLLTYLEVASQNAIELVKESELVTNLHELEDIIVKSAGMFYFHVHNPLLNVADYSDLSLLEEERLKQYKLKGYVLEDVDVALAMDETLAPSKTSKVVPIALTKDETFNGRGSNVLDEEKMDTLKRFVPKKLQQAGNEIYAGNTEIKPYRLGNKKACTYCEYKSICQFDMADPANSYNELKKIDKKEIHDKFKEVVSLDE